MTAFTGGGSYWLRHEASVGLATPRQDNPGTGQRSRHVAPGHVVSAWSRKRQIAANSSGSMRRPADQRAVHVVLRHDRGDVARLDRAAVEDPGTAVGHLVAGRSRRAGRGSPRTPPARPPASRPHRCRSPRSARRRRRSCGLLRPDAASAAVAAAPATYGDLPARPGGSSRFSPTQRIGVSPCWNAALHLGVDDLVGLAVVLAPLAVPDDRRTCSRAWRATRRRSRRCRRRTSAPRGPGRRT